MKKRRESATGSRGGTNAEKRHREESWFERDTRTSQQEVSWAWDRDMLRKIQTEKMGCAESKKKGTGIDRQVEKFIFLVKGFPYKGSLFFSPKTFIQPFCVFALFLSLRSHLRHAFQTNLLRKPTQQRGQMIVQRGMHIPDVYILPQITS